MKGMGKMMKQAQQLQSKMLKLQEEMADKTVETSSGGGMVKVVANGRQQVLSIILAAINDALIKSQEMATQEMSKLTGGLNIPGLT